MQKDTWLKAKRLMKKENSNKENKQLLIKDIMKPRIIHSRAIRHQINQEYGIKVTNHDLEMPIRNHYTRYKIDHTKLTDEELEQKMNHNDTNISGNTNQFILETVVQESINNNKCPYDSLCKRDKTKWKSDKLKVKQRKMDRMIKEQSNL